MLSTHSIWLPHISTRRFHKEYPCVNTQTGLFICSFLRQKNGRSPLRALYGGCPGDVTGLYLRYQGELLGLWDPQHRDPRRKPPPETNFRLVDYHALWVGGVN